MSNPQQSKQQPTNDDPLVISSVTFRDLVTIGGRGIDGWTVSGSAQNRYHGVSRVEPFQAGFRFVYKEGAHYEEIEVPWANIAGVSRVPLSRLEPKTREVYERMQQEIRR